LDLNNSQIKRIIRKGKKRAPIEKTCITFNYSTTTAVINAIKTLAVVVINVKFKRILLNLFKQS
jgi:hypothetical protein